MSSILSIDVGIKNLAFAVLQKNTTGGGCVVDSVGVIDLSCNGHVDVKDFESLMTSLMKALNSHFDEQRFDWVIIENQPVLKNPTMKSLQVGIYTHFLSRKVLNSTVIGNVRLYSASNKLKSGKGVSKDELSVCSALPDVAKVSNAYNKRKKLSIALVDYLIEKGRIVVSDGVSNTLKGTKKNDDMCDAVLQGYQFSAAL